MRTKSGNSESLCRYILAQQDPLQHEGRCSISHLHASQKQRNYHQPRSSQSSDLPMDLPRQPFLLSVVIVEFCMNQIKTNTSPCFLSDLQLLVNRSFFYFSLFASNNDVNKHISVLQKLTTFQKR